MYGTLLRVSSRRSHAQPMQSYGQPSVPYQAQPAPIARSTANSAGAYASHPAQPSTDQLRQLAPSRLKSKATVITVLSFLWCCTTPVILFVNVIFAQRLCTPHIRD